MPRAYGPLLKRNAAPTDVARDVYLRRIELGLTQAELARLIGVTQQVISQWEVGEFRPSAHRLQQLAELQS